MGVKMNWLIERFQIATDSAAFIHEDRTVKYKEVVAKTHAFLEEIKSAGISKDETVVLLGDYSPEVFCLMLALALNGSIIIPLTKDSVVEEADILDISGCEWYIDFSKGELRGNIEKRNFGSNNALLTSFREQEGAGLILFSSGSTGKPKAILHNFDRVSDKFRKLRQPITAIPFLMIDHFGGINTILSITANLGTVVTVSDRSVANICKAIEHNKVELLPATPSFLNLLITSGLHNKFDLSSLKRISYGTEVMPQTTLDRIKERFPNVVLQQTYGLSEVGVLSSKSREDGSLWVRVGGNGFETKVIDGILWVKSDFSMVGYLNAPSEFDEDGWFNTHDVVEVDGEYFRILGRQSDLINVGGQKVYPIEVENVIVGIENIRDVAIFSERHNLLGNIVVAKVLLEIPESVESVKRRIRKACLSCLAPFKAPSKVILAEGVLHNARQKKIRRADS
jgi:acyl-CoA synthetase (AMP-forming)/AMP-acid ligase II